MEIKKKEPAIAVKAMIVDKDEKILIIRREPKDIQNPDMWEIPGGRLDFYEDPFIGLRREVKEEVNLDIDIKNPLTVRHFTREDNQVITMIIFYCTPITKDVTLSKEHTDYEWIDIEKVKEKIGEFFHKDIDNYVRYFSNSN